MKKIELGDKVRCKYTKFVGVAVARTEFINGCIQYTVVPKVEKDNKYCLEEISIDEGALEVITPSKKPKKKIEKFSRSGGASRSAPKFRGY